MKALHMRIAAAILVASLVVLTPATAGAASGPDRVTQGDAQAVLNAAENGGARVLQHAGRIVASPADSNDPQVAIRPYSGTLFDGRHYCVEDWHVIAVAWGEGGDQSFTIMDARALMDDISITFSLDGAALATDRTATKRFLDEFLLAEFGWDRGYAFQQGAVMAPTDLAVGSHTLSWTLSSPLYGTFTDQITFYIDPAGEGACL
jgi:hypothetical protein